MIAGQSLTRKNSSMLRGAAVALLCAAALALWQAAASFLALQRAESAGALVRQVEAVQRSSLWVRAEHRSAIIEGDDRSLALYREADRDLQSNLDQLSRLEIGDPVGERALANLQRLLDSSRSRREQILKLRGANIAAARSALMSPEAIQARSAMTAAIDALARFSQAELKARSAGEQQALLWLVASIIALMITGAALGRLAVRDLRHYANEISASEARYRALSEDCPDGVIVVADMRVVYANGAALQLWNAPSERSVIGRELVELLHPDDRAIVRERIQMALEHGVATSPRVMRLLRENGTTHEVETRKTLIRYAEKPAIQVVARDVTERRAAELELVLSEQRFRAVLDAMAEGVVLQNETGAIKLCNRAAERILGLTTDQLQGRTSADSRWLALDASGNELPGDQHCAMIALRTGQPSTGHMSVQRPDGSRAALRVSAIPLFRPGEERPYGVTTTFADITEERAATQRLQQSMAQYRLLADNSADMVSRRTLDHRFEYVSPSHTAILGWSQEELLATPPLDLIHPDDVPIAQNGTIASIARGESGPETTLRVRHKNGHYIWVEALSTPICDAKGQVVAYTVCARDITARRALEQELREAQKLEAMGRMASAMAHDFNNILTVIHNATRLLCADTGRAQDPRLAEHAAEVGAAVERAARLTAQLLSFSHGQHSVPRLLSVTEVLHESRDLLSRLLPSHCSYELQLKVASEPMQVWGDKAELLQILANLVTNAADAMPSGGTIQIECAVERLLKPWTHRFGTLAHGSYVAISVTDCGAGIQPSLLERLFEPFFTTKAQGKGSGLGLSTVWGIVQQAHGSVTVDSIPGRGSRFTIYWPRCETPVHASSIPRSAQQHAGTRAPALLIGPSPVRSVLVVDDDAAVRSVTTRLLEHCGYRVLAAQSGADALQLLKEQRRDVQLIVSDVRMPQMSGIELVSQLLAAGIDLPVLFISGQLDAPLPSHWPRTVPRLFLAKPFAMEQLRPALEQLLQVTGMPLARAPN